MGGGHIQDEAALLAWSGTDLCSSNKTPFTVLCVMSAAKLRNVKMQDLSSRKLDFRNLL